MCYGILSFDQYPHFLRESGIYIPAESRTMVQERRLVYSSDGHAPRNSPLRKPEPEPEPRKQYMFQFLGKLKVGRSNLCSHGQYSRFHIKIVSTHVSTKARAAKHTNARTCVHTSTHKRPYSRRCARTHTRAPHIHKLTFPHTRVRSQTSAGMYSKKALQKV